MLLLFALIWWCQLTSGELEGNSIFLTNLKNRWYGPSYQPSWWTSNTKTLRSGDFQYNGANGQNSWPETFKDCGGQSQSPINVQTSGLKRMKTRKPLKWSNYSKAPKRMFVQNSLHSIHSNGIWENSTNIPFITNGPLEKRYYFSQLHFHWGETDEDGSEHTVNSKSFPLEMHVVHDRRIEDPTNLSQEGNSDNLVVVSYMFEIVKDDNPSLKPILDALPIIGGHVEKKTSIRSFPLDDLIEPFNGDYVSYKGSLTTPPCTEGVIWILSSKALGISDSQLARLRYSIKDQKGSVWQTVYHLSYWSGEILLQWMIKFLPCPIQDMMTWLESRARICEVVLIAFLIILIATYLNEWFGIYECFKPCKNVESFQFGYRKKNGPSVWKEHFEGALGQKQSPINILQSEVTTCYGPRLQWEFYNVVPESMIMYNDGYSIALDGCWKSGRPTLTGPSLGNELYIFNRLYFHWGPTDSEGSEHTLDYERFPLELHMIFLKEGFNTLMDAHCDKSANGIVIVVFLFEITPVDNPGFLSTVTNNLHKVKTPRTACCVEPFALNDIYPQFEFNYYKYDGSITQPPCSEIVTYVVQSETIAVSKRQMSRFRKLVAFDGRPMVNNSRPVQKLNRRTVYYFTT